jgi:DNA-binding CsgD family transcriptional regulator
LRETAPSPWKQTIVDELYEAAFIPNKWSAALARITAAAASKGGALFVFAEGQPNRGKAITPLQPLMDEVLADVRLSTAATRMSTIRPASFVDVDSFMTPAEIRDDPIRIRLRALGLGAHACTAIPMPSGEMAMFVFQRGLEDGDYGDEHFTLLDRLRPDMARASLAAARLSLEQARGAVDALTTMGLPAAILTANGRVTVANALFEREHALFVPTAFGGVALANPDSNRLLQLALQRSGSAHIPRSIPIQHAGGAAMVMHVLPLKRDAHDLFSGGDLLIAATKISASALVPSPTILTGLFDLTPAEVGLAAALAKGQSLKVAAAEAGLQFSTMRTYLNRIFRKTGTTSKASSWLS